MLLTMQRLWQAYDGAVRKIVIAGLVGLGFKEIGLPPSPVTASLPFVRTPTPIITAILVYLLITLTGKWLITNRAGSRDKKMSKIFLCTVQAHNLFLILLSSFMSSSAAYLAWKHKYNFWGQGYNPSEKDMGFVVYVFYLSKYVEFLDTFIMIAKGAVRQISVLHVYHHVSISFIWWTIAYVAPGGDAWYSTFLNSLVHVVMYTYYFIAALLGSNEKAKKRYLWWGRYLTQFQMFQFVTMLSQAAYTWVYSPYPKFLSKLLFFYMLSLLALFAQFYVQKYTPSRKGRVTRKEE